VKIKDLIQTCSACPSQWEARTETDNRPVYIRFRWGYLSIRVGEPGKAIEDAVQGREIYGAELGKDEWNGVIGWEEVAPIIDALPEMSEIAVQEAKYG